MQRKRSSLLSTGLVTMEVEYLWFGLLWATYQQCGLAVALVQFVAAMTMLFTMIRMNHNENTL